MLAPSPLYYTRLTSHPHHATAPLPKALKDAEALALDASGLLFNVETAMDFFVIDEVLVSLATQHKDRDVQVWASGIYQSYQPNGFVKRQLKRSLRCSPKIQEVLEHVEKDICVSRQLDL